METATVGKVYVKAKIENSYDLESVSRGLLTYNQVRRLEVDDARVDTVATYLALTKKRIEDLGLTKLRTAQARTAAGMVSFGIDGPAKLTIQGRECVVEVSEVADGCPVLIGFFPLELLDFVVDLKGQRLIGNPDHGGEWIIDMFHQDFDK
jgi:predicted aspartyl protease